VLIGFCFILDLSQKAEEQLNFVLAIYVIVIQLQTQNKILK
jgi:hypothetical protein